METIKSVSLDGAEFYYCNDAPCLKIGQDRYELGQEPFYALLNLLKIPIKYLHRFAAEDGEQASKNVNFWLSRKGPELVLAVKGDEVVNVTNGGKSFIPAQTVINIVGKYYLDKHPFVQEDGDLTVAQFATGISVDLEDGKKGNLSLRLIYSDHFAITPRVDAVLTVDGCFENYYFPIQGRKFRVVGMSHTEIINQIMEFGDIVLEQMQKQFVPSLNTMIGYDAKLNVFSFVDRLCTELRLPTRICNPLLEGIEGPEESLHVLVRLINNNLLSEVRSEMIDIHMARDIEIAMSKAIMLGRFK